jgi:hypothetical protein
MKLLSNLSKVVPRGLSFFVILGLSLPAMSHHLDSDFSSPSSSWERPRPLEEDQKPNEYQYSSQRGLQLFRFGRVTLGRTTIEELKSMGAEKIQPFNYAIGGLIYWVHPQTRLVYTIVKNLSQNEFCPVQWRQVGLDSDLSYRRASSWLRSQNFRPIEVVRGSQIEGTMITDSDVYTIKMEFFEGTLSKVTLLTMPRPR